MFDNRGIRWLGLLVLIVSGCTGDPGTGTVEVHWDRDSCERCRMVLSDRYFAAQVRLFPEGKRSRVYKFDDLGCAVLWLDRQSLAEDAMFEIWVKDHQSGNWIDAQTAAYVDNKVTPMEYGLGAQTQATPGTLSFDEARGRIYEVEKRFGIHGLHLQHEPGAHNVQESPTGLERKRPTHSHDE